MISNILYITQNTSYIFYTQKVFKKLYYREKNDFIVIKKILIIFDVFEDHVYLSLALRLYVYYKCTISLLYGIVTKHVVLASDTDRNTVVG